VDGIKTQKLKNKISLPASAMPKALQAGKFKFFRKSDIEKMYSELSKYKFSVCKAVLLLSVIICFTVPFRASAAFLYLLPQSQTVLSGEILTVTVYLDTEGQEINAIQADLKFDSAAMQVVDLNVGGSILSLWPKDPSISEEKKEISITGGVPNGFKGQGVIERISFYALEPNESNSTMSLNFQNSSMALLNDGKGTKADLNFFDGQYEVISRPKDLPVVSCGQEPGKTSWIASNILYIHWNITEGVEYSYILSRDPTAEPDGMPDKPGGDLKWMGDMKYEGLGDGMYYFSLKQKISGNNWSEKTTCQSKIDTMPPENFAPEISKDPSIFSGNYFLSFTAQDKTSGIDHFEVREHLKAGTILSPKEKSEWIKIASPYLLRDQKLQSLIEVKAVDKAGNEMIVSIPAAHKPSSNKLILLLAFVVLIIIFIVFRLFRAMIK